MPHFVIDCSPGVIKQKSPEEIITLVHDTAEKTALFRQGDIKVRLRMFEFYTVGGTHNNFIHVFGYIMQGRTTEQKGSLSKQIITELKKIFPDVPVISMNVMDFEKASYCNRTMV